MSDPGDTPTDGISLTAERKAVAVVDGLMHGMTLEEIAAKCTGGSLVRVLQIMMEGLAPGDLQALIAAGELQCGIMIEVAKIDAMITLGKFISGEGFNGLREAGLITQDDMRLMELRRRACLSILRLNPLPTRRDSYGDSRFPTTSADAGAGHDSASSSNPQLEVWREAIRNSRPITWRERSGEGIASPDEEGATASPHGLDANDSPHEVGGMSQGDAAEPMAGEAHGPATPRLQPGDESSSVPVLNRAARRRLLRLQKRAKPPDGSTPPPSSSSSAGLNSHPP